MTGLKYENHGTKVLKILIPYILHLDQIKEDKILDRHNNVIPNEETNIFSTLITSDVVQKSEHKLVSD